MAEETNSPPPEKSEAKPAEPKAKKPAKPAEKAKPAAAKAKKAKKPTVEDKPFAEFIEQDFLPALKTAIAKEGANDLNLEFVDRAIPIVGAANGGSCWQVRGSWDKGNYQFNVYFPEANIKGQKGFSFSTNGANPSILESFMIDERKVTLDLLVMYVVQRLNAEKLLARN